MEVFFFYYLGWGGGGCYSITKGNRMIVRKALYEWKRRVNIINYVKISKNVNISSLSKSTKILA